MTKLTDGLSSAPRALNCQIAVAAIPIAATNAPALIIARRPNHPPRSPRTGRGNVTAIRPPLEVSSGVTRPAKAAPNSSAVGHRSAGS